VFGGVYLAGDNDFIVGPGKPDGGDFADGYASEGDGGALIDTVGAVGVEGDGNAVRNEQAGSPPGKQQQHEREYHQGQEDDQPDQYVALFGIHDERSGTSVYANGVSAL
jgi:hypothetical protein